MTYLKILNSAENHNDLQYVEGLNIDPIPFQPKGSCVAGGIYFTSAENITKFLDYGIWVREVTIPEGSQMVKDPQGDKWRADKVILGPRKSLSEVSTWEYLVSVGADVRVHDDEAVRWASLNGHLEIVKYLVSLGAQL